MFVKIVVACFSVGSQLSFRLRPKRYNCDGAASKKSNGPTDCYNFNVGCAVSSTHTACPFTSRLPADCNGGLVDYGTAECEQTWYIGARGCSIYGTPSGYACTGWTWGGPGGTQACR